MDKKYYCRDCAKEIKIDKDNNLIKGKLLEFDIGDEEKMFILKCNKCFKLNPSLENYQECEVYSRIVGYLRPIKQWHEGKLQEYKERKEYKVKKLK